MANYQELANLVWTVADDVLRGLFKQHEYGDITLPFSGAAPDWTASWTRTIEKVKQSKSTINSKIKYPKKHYRRSS